MTCTQGGHDMHSVSLIGLRGGLFDWVDIALALGVESRTFNGLLTILALTWPYTSRKTM